MNPGFMVIDISALQEMRDDAGPSSQSNSIQSSVSHPARTPLVDSTPTGLLPLDWVLEDSFEHIDGRWHCTHPSCIAANSKPRKPKRSGATQQPPKFRFYGIYTASRTFTSGILKRAKEHAAKHCAKMAKQNPRFDPYPIKEARGLSRHSSSTSLPVSEVDEASVEAAEAAWESEKARARGEMNPPPSL